MPQPAFTAPAGAAAVAAPHPVRRQVIIAVMAFLTVVDLFATQAILPALRERYGVSPAAMSVAVNACTIGMAIAGAAVALLGSHLGRRAGIVASLALLTVPTLLLAHAPDLRVFAALRVAQGLCMAAAFTLTLAYLGEAAMSREEATAAFAAYVTGNVASNLVGRMLASSLAEGLGLSPTFYAFAALNLAGAVLAYIVIRGGSGGAQPAGRRSGPAILAERRLLAAFAIGFCILFAFIGVFTFVNFMLVRPPLSLPAMALGLVYLVFLPSVVTTPLAGRAAARLGVHRSLVAMLALAGLGLPLLLVPQLVAILPGLALVAVGTFAAQAVATGYVSRAAPGQRAAASGIYLASYFCGGLAGTAALGALFDGFGWTACILGVAAALLVAIVLATGLSEPDDA